MGQVDHRLGASLTPEMYEQARREGECAVRGLVQMVPLLRPVLDESIADNDGVYPHLVMSDTIRWMVAHVATDIDSCRMIMGWMEEQLEVGSDAVRNMVAVSGVEMLPYPGEPGDELRAMMGPRLRGNDPLREVDDH